jgi:hypothetical protein
MRTPEEIHASGFEPILTRCVDCETKRDLKLEGNARMITGLRAELESLQIANERLTTTIAAAGVALAAVRDGLASRVPGTDELGAISQAIAGFGAIDNALRNS